MTTHFESELPASRELLAALGKAFDAAIPLWLDTMMVTQVQGSGPVPGFAPPDAPAGPVIGGTGAMQRGGGFF